MGCVHFIVKYTLFLLNLIFTVIAIGLITIGVLVRLKLLEAESDVVVINEELETVKETLTTFVIVLGCVVFIIAFTGCCGAVTETKCLLITYAVTLLILLTVKIYLAIVWNKDTDSLRQIVKEYIDDAFDEPGQNATIHLIEASFHCCGIIGPDSYEVLPPTCCELQSSEGIISADSICALENAFSIGCLELFDNFITEIAQKLKTVLIGIIVFEALEFAAAVYLCLALKDINKFRK